jgi:hypothetical protein
MRAHVVIPIVSLLLAVPLVASAQRGFNTPPEGAGTARREPGTPAEAIGREGRTTPGIQAEGLLGTGFNTTYGLGAGARVGYAMTNGIYLGGAATYYAGNSVDTAQGSNNAYAMFLGGEVGYIFYPSANRKWSIRPYVFGGPGVVQTAQASPFLVQKSASFALEPGVMGAYHFGHVFLAADARYHIEPTPGAFALFLGAGYAF